MSRLLKLEAAKSALLDIVGMMQAELAESEYPTMSLFKAVNDRANEALDVIEKTNEPERGEFGFICRLRHWHRREGMECPDDAEFEGRRK